MYQIPNHRTSNHKTSNLNLKIVSKSYNSKINKPFYKGNNNYIKLITKNNKKLNFYYQTLNINILLVSSYLKIFPFQSTKKYSLECIYLLIIKSKYI